VTNEQQSSPDHGIPVDTESLKEVERFCQRVIGHLDLDLKVEATEGQGSILLSLSGSDRPLLLSNTASVLNSLEYLLNRVFRTGKGERIGSILLDSENYRQHREAELMLLAEMASKKVLAQGRSMTLQPMTPRERRIVHLALAEIRGVRSESHGEGEERSITIFPS
jgi:spoIIIJ-associated protein